MSKHRDSATESLESGPNRRPDQGSDHKVGPSQHWPEATRPRGLSSDPADPPEEKVDLELDIETAESAKGDAAARSKEKRPLRTPRRPGLSATARDLAILREVVLEQVRRERHDLGDEEIAELAETRFNELCQLPHPRLPREYKKLMLSSWCPNRRHIRDHVEVKALRQLPEAKVLEDVLSACEFGRPSERRLATATFIRLAMGDCRPEVRAAVKEFRGSNRELDWAYLDATSAGDVNGDLRDETCVRKTMKAALERNDAELANALNMSVVNRIAARHADAFKYLYVDAAVNRIAARHADAFKYLYVDATPIEAHLEQVGDVSAGHARLLNRGTGARFGHHGGRNRRPKSWRGWKLLVLGSVKLGLGLITKLIPASEPEYPHLEELLHRFFALVDQALLPAEEIYLVGDSEYDRKTRLAFDLEQRMLVVPVFDLRETLSMDYEWAESEGVPVCAKHGTMKRLQDENFCQSAIPIVYEDDFEAAKKDYEARIRWQCQGCKDEGVKVRATTWARRNARIYTYLPRRGDDWRYALRLALMARRNGVESINSQLKLRGIGGRGHFKAKWVSRLPHMQWLCQGAVLAMSLRRDAHESGLYAAAAEEAYRLDLVKEPLQVPETAITGGASAGARQ